MDHLQVQLYLTMAFTLVLNCKNADTMLVSAY